MEKSNKQIHLRKYQAHHSKQWSFNQMKKFYRAVKLFGNSHSSNKKIADYMGGNVHPNQVAYQKKLLNVRSSKN
jgi:hypothetical protein